MTLLAGVDWGARRFSEAAKDSISRSIRETRSIRIRPREICPTIFGKPFSCLTKSEKATFKRYMKKASYYRRHQRNLHTMRDVARDRKVRLLQLAGKEPKCERCGYRGYIGALDFHHRNPDEKDFTLASMSSFGVKRLLREVAKCDLVCANCHREIHGGSDDSRKRRGRPKSVDPMLAQFLAALGCLPETVSAAMEGRPA